MNINKTRASNLGFFSKIGHVQIINNFLRQLSRVGFSAWPRPLRRLFGNHQTVGEYCVTAGLVPSGIPAACIAALALSIRMLLMFITFPIIRSD